MKKIIAIVLSCVLTLVGCGQNVSTSNNSGTVESSVQVTTFASEESIVQVEIPEGELGDSTPYEYLMDFDSLDDEELHRYVQDNIYNELVAQLDSDEYFIENISTVYISQEYIDELTYNSRPNVYFGYTLEEIDAVYQGTRYVFTVSEEGDTIVVPFEEYDDTFEQVLKNVAIGTGVILVCVTVSVVSAGAGAPAVSMIFAASAKSGTIFALSSGSLSAIASGIVTGIETGDMDEALKAAALSGSESFKWGAITGVISGGATETVKYAKAMNALKGTSLNGLTIQQAAAIQMESGYPVEVIKQFHTMEEYNVFKLANLKSVMVNGQAALVRKDIDLNLVDDYGRTNLERMKLGLSPLDSNNKTFELHHIGQEADASLAILTQSEHDNAVLHGFKAISEIDREAFRVQRSNFWKTMAKLLENGGI